MSLACRPGAPFAVTLPVDATLPEERRPRFIVRHLSCLDWSDLAAFADDKAALQSQSVQSIVSALLGLLAKHLSGWANVVDVEGKPIPFPEVYSDNPSPEAKKACIRAKADALGQVLTLDEAWELYDEIRQQSRLSVTEKNASTSQSASHTDLSADASPAPAKA